MGLRAIRSRVHLLFFNSAVDMCGPFEGAGLDLVGDACRPVGLEAARLLHHLSLDQRQAHQALLTQLLFGVIPALHLPAEGCGPLPEKGRGLLWGQLVEKAETRLEGAVLPVGLRDQLPKPVQEALAPFGCDGADRPRRAPSLSSGRRRADPTLPLKLLDHVIHRAQAQLDVLVHVAVVHRVGDVVGVPRALSQQPQHGHHQRSDPYHRLVYSHVDYSEIKHPVTHAPSLRRLLVGSARKQWTTPPCPCWLCWPECSRSARPAPFPWFPAISASCPASAPAGGVRWPQPGFSSPASLSCSPLWALAPPAWGRC